MEALGSATSIIAVVQVAGSVAQLCGGYIADVKDACQDIERLQQKAATLHDVLQRMAEANDRGNPKPLNLSDNVLRSVDRCSQDLGKLQEKLQPKKRHKTMSKFGVRALKWPLSKSSVNEELDHIAISQGIDRKIDQGRDDQLLKSISHIGDAAYDSYENQRHQPCLTNTRVDLLQEITDWATCNSSQYIFWLRGRAGTGKSTIALTMAQALDRQGAFLASFFFKRGGGDLARSRMVISTIVYQLATRSRLLGRFICEALQEYPNLGDSASLSQQYDKLLLRPLQRARQSAPHSPLFIIVLDALDECDDLNDVRLLLLLLGDTQNMAGFGIRVLVTSRPEIPIRLGFHNMKHIAYHQLALHDVPRAIVDQDIKTFVTHELAQIKVERNLPNFWPGDNKIQIITTRADGLFIYAATVCRYVNGPWQVSASERLDQVCQSSGEKHKSTEALDTMYLIVLASSMKGDFSPEEEDKFTLRLRQVVGSVVLLFDNLSAEELARLLFPGASTDGVIIQETLVSLHAVFDVPEDLSKPIQMLHLSFRDFVVDSARCPDVRFQVNEQQVHHDLFDRCLDLMERSLVQNICQLPGSGVLIDEVSEAVLMQYLPFRLRYACRHWISHAQRGRVSLSDNDRVHNFLRRCLLYWLEAMSLTGKIPEATTMMIQLESLIEAKKAPGLQSLVQDALRFMLTFSRVLNKAPLQLYSAELLFSPFNSIVRNSFGAQATRDFEVKGQLPLEWNACIQILEGHSNLVTSAVFSSDGSRVASGSWDRTVRVWDVQTGQCVHALEGHLDQVNSVVFSPDGSRVVSGSDDQTVRVWDVQTGQCMHALNSHSSKVSGVVFSPDGSRVVSYSWDQTVRIWDVQTGQCVHTLKGHSDRVTSVVFSPDGSRVASGSGDQTVRVWDVQTGQCVHALEVHSDRVVNVEFWGDGSRAGVRSVAFSPDGSRVASGSCDQKVRMWEVQTGQYLYLFKGHLRDVLSVAFSPDGSRVVSGSLDRTVRIWDVQTGQCVHVLEGHSDGVGRVVFSPDGSRVASSGNEKVCVWNVQTGQCVHALEGHLGAVGSVMFSPDGSRVVSSGDNTVRIWDVQTGQSVHAHEYHSAWVVSVVFSPDGLWVASGSWDETVRMWDVRTGQCVYALKGHSDGVTSVMFSPDASRVASGSCDQTVRVWDVQTGQCVHALKGHSDVVRSVAFSPDGSRVASGSDDQTVRMWDVQMDQCIHTLEGHSGGVTSVMFSPDGLWVASGSMDQTVRVWDVQTGQCVHALKDHSGAVGSVVFSPDGLRVASGSEAQTVRVWDISSMTELLHYDIGTASRSREIQFTEDSTGIMVNGAFLPVQLQTRFAITTARTPGHAPTLPASQLGIRGDWITLSSREILWLPPEYRTGIWGSWATRGDTIAIGSSNGRVTFIRHATKALEVDHPDTLTRISNVASVLQDQGKYEQAEEMNRRALAGREKALGMDHPDTLTSVGNLASALQYQGKYEQAEEMHQRALAGYEKVLGVDHPDTLTSVSNIASMLQDQGKYEQAEEMNRRALAGYEKVLGVDHPNTLTSVSNMASVLQDQGKYEQAEGMHRRALVRSRKALGVDHPNTLTSMSNLASALQAQGKYNQAEEMQQRALAGYEKVLGVDHPWTLTSVSNLAMVLQAQEKYDQAEEIHRRALAVRETALGVDHPDTLTSVSNLAVVLRYQGKYEQAEEMHLRALEGSEKALGVDHSDTLTNVNNLVLVLQDQGKYEQAEEMNRRALAGRETALGADHPDTLTSMSNLASALQYQGKYEQAEEMHQRALAGYEKVLGVDHPDTLTSVSNVASVLQDQGKYEQAEEMNRRALVGRETSLGADHPDTLASVYCLAQLLGAIHDHHEALTLYDRAIIGYNKVLGPEHPTTAACQEHRALLVEKAAAAPGGDEPVNLFEAVAQAGQGVRGAQAEAGAGAGATNLSMDFFRDSPHFQHLRQLIQRQPAMFEPIQQHIVDGYPQLARMIGQDQEQFLDLLSEGIGGDAIDGMGESGPMPPGAVPVSVTERDAIERLCHLGFPRDQVVQAFFAYDKNEELATNFLYNVVIACLLVGMYSTNFAARQ